MDVIHLSRVFQVFLKQFPIELELELELELARVEARFNESH